MKQFNRQQFIEDLISLTTREVKWLHQGSDAAVGLDCINIARWAYRNQGFELPTELDEQFQAYHHKPDGEKLLAVMRQYFAEIELKDAQPADLLVVYYKRNAQHMRIIINETQVVEAFRSSDGHICRVLVRRLHPMLHVAGCFRIPDFA